MQHSNPYLWGTGGNATRPVAKKNVATLAHSSSPTRFWYTCGFWIRWGILPKEALNKNSENP